MIFVFDIHFSSSQQKRTASGQAWSGAVERRRVVQDAVALRVTELPSAARSA